MNRQMFWMAMFASILGAVIVQGIAWFPLRSVEADWEDGDDETTSTRIGFVDVKKVFERYEKTRDRERDINERYRVRVEELRKAKMNLEEKKKDFDLYGPNSPERRRLEKEFALDAFEVEFQQKWIEEQVKEDLKASTEEIFSEVLAQVGGFADPLGYQAVLKIDEEGLESITRNELKLKIHTRTVLYYRSGDDLTEPIIEFLNEKYREGR